MSDVTRMHRTVFALPTATLHTGLTIAGREGVWGLAIGAKFVVSESDDLETRIRRAVEATEHVRAIAVEKINEREASDGDG